MRMFKGHLEHRENVPLNDEGYIKVAKGSVESVLSNRFASRLVEELRDRDLVVSVKTSFGETEIRGMIQVVGYLEWEEIDDSNRCANHSDE